MAFWEASAELRLGLVPRLAAVRARLTWRHGVFALVLVLYAVMTTFIVLGSPMDQLDEYIVSLRLHDRWPGIDRFMLDYVMLGQRAPSTLLALPWFLWICFRRRSITPMIRLATALLLLNVTVGFVKVSVGRYGPLRTSNAHDVLAGGNIFPSGHVSNAVILYGVMAMSVLTYRKTMIAAATFVCVTVGLTTLYLNTHWLSDVVGAWLAGSLVLMILPACVPRVERALRALYSYVRGWLARGPKAQRAGPHPVKAQLAGPHRLGPAASSAGRRSRPVPAASVRPPVRRLSPYRPAPSGCSDRRGDRAQVLQTDELGR